jgi:hypothetical protein
MTISKTNKKTPWDIFRYLSGIKADVLSSAKTARSSVSDMTTALNGKLSEVSIIADTATDVAMSSGSLGSAVELHLLPIILNDGCEIFGRIIRPSPVQINSIDIDSVETIVDSVATKKDITSSVVNIKHSNTKEVDMQITLKLSTYQTINSLKMKFGDSSIKTPVITGIQVITKFGPREILIGGESQFVYANEIVDSLLNIRFDQMEGIGIIINLSQPFQTIQFGTGLFILDIESIGVNFAIPPTRETKIIIGPYSSKKEIKKIAIRSSSKNTKYFISHDNKSYIQISSYESNSGKRIVKYNTKYMDSIKTDDPVKSIYVKIVFETKSETTTKENSIFTYVETYEGQESYSSNEEVKKRGIEKFGSIYNKTIKANGKIEKYSPYTTLLDGNRVQFIQKFPNTKIEDGYIKRELKRGFIEEEVLKLEEEIDSSKLIVYEISKPYPGVSKQEGTIRVLKIKDEIKLGSYIIYHNGSYSKFEIEKEFCTSLIGFMLEVEKNDYPYTLMTEDLKKISEIPIVEINNKKILDMSEIFFEIPESINKYYGIADNNIGEYSISEKGNYAISVSRKEHSTNEFSKNIEIEPIRRIKKQEIIKFQNSKSEKLNKIRIVKGSIKIINTESGISNFINEIPFVDGAEEFIESVTEIKTYQIQTNKIGINTENLKIIDSYNILSTEVFSKEEIYFDGDYFIGTDGIYFYNKNNLQTINIKIEKKQSRFIFGSFSVDYVNGKIFTPESIFDNIEIEYEYTNVFMQVSGIEILSPLKNIQMPIENSGQMIVEIIRSTTENITQISDANLTNSAIITLGV